MNYNKHKLANTHVFITIITKNLKTDFSYFLSKLSDVNVPSYKIYNPLYSSNYITTDCKKFLIL